MRLNIWIMTLISLLSFSFCIHAQQGFSVRLFSLTSPHLMQPLCPQVPLSHQAEVKAFVHKAVDYVKANGEAVALKAFAQPYGPFSRPGIYIFAIDYRGNILADGNHWNVIGENQYDIKDVKGRSIVRALIEKGRYGEGAWVSYYWTNPATQNEECKSSYVTTVDKKFIIGAGFYHPSDVQGNCNIS